MNKQEIYDYLNEKNISYEITNHKAVYNMGRSIKNKTSIY